jgi:hypothetical protein
MARIRTDATKNDAAEPRTPVSSAEPAAEQPPAWEAIENGRYRPRRIRGSCRGRELG